MYFKEIESIIKNNKQSFGLKDFGPVKITELGRGENNIILLVSAARKRFVFRIGMGGGAASQLKQEFENLSSLPAHFGPRPIYQDLSKRVVPRPFSVLSYVPGVSLGNWDSTHLRMHGQKLAKLHTTRYSFWRALGERDYKRVFDLDKHFARWVKECHRFRVKDREFDELLTKAKQFINRHNHLFLALTCFSRIHGDLYADNILFSNSSVRYIDWEMMGIGDGAEDLARFFCRSQSYTPWYIKLSERQLNLLVKSYREYNDDSTLKQRVTVLNIYFHCADLLYFMRKLERCRPGDGTFDRSYYEACIQILKRSLAISLALESS